MQTLAEIVRGLRERAGYASSRKFFNDHGGRKFFGCTYRQYLNVESGASLPSSSVLAKIAIALGLAHKPQARDFVLAYLRSLGLEDELLTLVVSALAQPAPAGASLVPALAKGTADRGIDLNQEQSAFMSAAFENYWTFTVLANDTGAWTVEDLAAAIGSPKPVVAKAAAGLAKLGLISKDAQGRYSCPNVGKIFRHPNTKVYTVGFEKLRRYKDKMGEKKGETLFRYHLCTRGSEAQARQYFPFLAQAVQGAGVCSVQQKGPDTVFFEVEAIVRRLLPF